MQDCNDTMRADCAAHLATIQAQNQEQYQLIKRIDKALNGNGTPGLIVRVDRLEQSETKRGRFLWVLLTAAVGAIVTGIANLLK